MRKLEEARKLIEDAMDLIDDYNCENYKYDSKQGKELEEIYCELRIQEDVLQDFINN